MIAGYQRLSRLQSQRSRKNPSIGKARICRNRFFNVVSGPQSVTGEVRQPASIGQCLSIRGLIRQHIVVDRDSPVQVLFTHRLAGIKKP